jgi:diguanylate cyclase (GGDEF)-like protein
MVPVSRSQSDLRFNRWYLSLAAAVALCLLPLLYPVLTPQDDRLFMYPYGAALYLLPLACCIHIARKHTWIRRMQWLALAAHFAMLCLTLWAPTMTLWAGWPPDPVCSWLISGFGAAASMFCLLSLSVLSGAASRNKRLLDALMVLILTGLSYLASTSSGPSGFSQYHLQVTVFTAVFLLCCAQGARRSVTSASQQFFVETVEIYLISRVLMLFLIDVVDYMWLPTPRELPFDLLYATPELCFCLAVIYRKPSQPVRMHSALWANLLPSLTVLAAVGFALHVYAEHPILSSIAILLTVVSFVLRTHLQYHRMLNEQRGLLVRTGRLEELATQDALTGIWNRRWLEQNAFALLEQAPATPVALMLIDTDHFKEINDTYGHLAGDQLLIAIGDQLRRRVGGIEGACYARLGGDEFVALLPRFDLRSAVEAAERLRVSLSSLHVEEGLDGNSAHCSVSIGVVAVDEKIALNGLLELADGALYRAKKRGRDIVVAATDDEIASYRARLHSPTRHFRAILE